MPLKTTTLLACGLIVFLVVLFGRLPGNGQWNIDLTNAAHGPAFMILTIVVLSLASEAKWLESSLFPKYLASITAVLLLGALAEILQHFTGRDAELRDLWSDALGAIAAAGGFFIFDPRVTASPKRTTLQRIGFGFAVAACLLILAPLAKTAAAYLHRNQSFPTLFDFSSPVSTYFVAVHSPILVERQALPIAVPEDAEGAVGLRVRLQNQNGWWRVFLKEPYPDWGGYDQLVLDLANPTGVPFSLLMQVRYRNEMDVVRAGNSAYIEIAPRSRHISSVPIKYLAIPGGLEQTDFSIVNSIVLNKSPANKGTEFYVMRVSLE